MKKNHIRFQKIVRLEDYPDIDSLMAGRVFVFPKIDGSNIGVWKNSEDDVILCGSRNRIITKEKPHFDFLEYLDRNLGDFAKFFQEYPHLRLFGEYLVIHSLRTYRPDALRKFYIFDVYNEKTNLYLSYEEYKPMLEKFNLLFIPPLAIVNNPTLDNFYRLTETNDYLIQTGKGVGEGIVIKNYDFFVDSDSNQLWAKIVRSEFKEKHKLVMGAPEVNGKKTYEEIFVDEFCTTAFLEKEFAKFKNEKGGWKSSYISELFDHLFYTLIEEEMVNAVARLKVKQINFRLLKAKVVARTKEVLSKLF